MDPVFQEGTAPLKDTRLDLYAFAAAFLTGLVLYGGLHVLLRVEQIWITLAIVGVMLAYAFAVARVPKLRVRLDQAGDNAYYLGLLFTLMSMAFALYEFAEAINTAAPSSDDRSTAVIIGNFGVALASTITGIFLRVILHQMRVDPADVESMTRIELSDASKRVRANLDTVSGDMARFHDEMRQRAGDVIGMMNKEATEQIRKMALETAEMLGGLTRDLAAVQAGVIEKTRLLTKDLEAAANEAVAAAGRLKAIEPPPLTFSRRLEKIGNKLETTAAAIDALIGKLDKAGGMASETTKSMYAASTAFDTITKSAEQSQAALDVRLGRSVDGVESALQKLGDVLRKDRAELAELEQQSRRSAEEAVRAGQAAVGVLETLTEVTRKVTLAIDQGGQVSV